MPFFAKILQPGEAICNEDAAMWHNATDIYPANADGMGHRDIWILACNRWDHRRYGDEFDEASLRDGQAQWELDHPDECLQLTKETEDRATGLRERTLKAVVGSARKTVERQTFQFVTSTPLPQV